MVEARLAEKPRFRCFKISDASSVKDLDKRRQNPKLSNPESHALFWIYYSTSQPGIYNAFDIEIESKITSEIRLADTFLIT
ncbi:hypothetical protein CEXT_526151 [Caerostris extrusa]|uniref:Uncharacterized protein n=1 Tax=Caerostris extrusa TaxID=172846 RepID=A0AAV4PZG6_CAEEX|nr:hypothetical protein CEXT_526151 [Caerostris extrusa]